MLHEPLSADCSVFQYAIVSLFRLRHTAYAATTARAATPAMIATVMLGMATPLEAITTRKVGEALD
jgi:hypothetical protein